MRSVGFAERTNNAKEKYIGPETRHLRADAS